MRGPWWGGNPGRGGCLGGPSTKWGGPGGPAGHTAARSGGVRVRFPWPAVAHVRFGWATSRRSGGTILRGSARGLSPTRARDLVRCRNGWKWHKSDLGKAEIGKMISIRNLPLAALRQVAAYVRGTQLIWGFGLRPGVSFEADSASF